MGMGDRAESRPLHGRPGTKALPLANARAIGGPIALPLLASYFAVALAGLLAAAIVLVGAAPSLTAGITLAPRPVLATHLVALGFLPFAVTAASFHLLPIMLRNDIGHPRRLWLALPLLCGGFLVAPGVAYREPTVLWIGASLLTGGLVLVLSELLGLVRHAPRGRTLVASRVGIALVCVNVISALALGAIVFSRGYRPIAGVEHDRWLLAHFHLALLGWLALLIVTVGRTLGPMLSFAPTPPERRLPTEELAVGAGVWVLVVGLAAASRPAALAGAAIVLLALASFGRQMLRVARTRRLVLEAPLAHLLAGVAFVAQAAGLGLGMLVGVVSTRTGMAAYVVFLLLGWAAGVTFGHLGKLLSLSLWVWWPPGPRPKQAALYPRTLWLAEAGAFVAGVELVAVGSLSDSLLLTRAGAVLVVVAAVLGCSGAGVTWRRRW